MHIPPSINSHYHSLSRRDISISLYGRPRHQKPSPLWSATDNASYRTAASSMSTKPSYLDDDSDDPGTNEDDSEHQLQWLKRSSGWDNVSQYDNFKQYASPAEKLKGGNYVEEGSLLHLLNNENVNESQNGNGMERTDTKHGEEVSLLRLMKKDQ